MINPFHIIFSAFIFIFLYACNSKKANADDAQEDSLVLIQKDSSAAGGSNSRPPIINMLDTIAAKYIVVYVKDSASTSLGMSQKLQDLFTIKLPEYLKNEKLETDGSPMVWYKTVNPPFYFEAGIPVTNKPSGKSKIFLVKNIGGDSAVVAHYFGPYSKTNVAYDVLSEWAKENKKKKKGIPYEIYVSNPWSKSETETDPYRMQTDIVFPHN